MPKQNQVTVDIKLGPNLMFIADVLATSCELLQVVPDYVPERKDLETRIRTLHGRVIFEMKVQNGKQT